MTVLQSWECIIPLQIVSVANLREHWAQTARRAKDHRNMAKLYVQMETGVKAIHGLYTVTITRHGGRRMDSDNLASGCKAVRDGIADAMGVDDGSPCIEWRYAQGPAKRGQHFVRVVLERVSADGV